MLKEYFIKVTKEAVHKAVNENKLGQKVTPECTLVCEKPKNPDFGDFAINVSSLAKEAKIAPPLIARNIMELIKKDNFDVNCTAGFINFKCQNQMLYDILDEILKKGKEFAKPQTIESKKINLEYVSANPTGPFHIGHGRWAAVGSALANVLKYTGNEVFQEFYINDAGNQINKLGMSLELRVKELLGEKIEMPEDSYRGDYLIECAKKYIEEKSNEDYAEYAKKDMLARQQKLLEEFNVHFDLFFSETNLYKNHEVQDCVQKLDDMGKLYEKDGAVWFKSSDYGDEQDRVIKKADGSNTYLTADIAYHFNKLKRGFDTLINIWGADHHGYIKRIEASIEALGHDPKCLEVLLGQLVNIIQNGEAVRMGKRKKMVTLDELIQEVGSDATRFWMLMRSIDTTLDFDIDLAKSKTDQNPVFYVQYAHARACSILRKATVESVDTLEKGKVVPPPVNSADLEDFLKNPDFSNLLDKDEQSLKATKALILKLEELKQVIHSACALRAPYLLCKYLQELAGDFHHFYNFTRVITDNKNTTLARLCLIECTKTAMGLALNLIGVDAPQKM